MGNIELSGAEILAFDPDSQRAFVTTGGDRLEGGFGRDILIGGAGRDVFIIGLGDGANVIVDFNSIDSVTDIAVQQGSDLILVLDEAEDELLMIRNTEVDQLSQQNVII